VKTDAGRFLCVKEKAGHRFLNMLAKVVPGVALCKYVVRKTFRNKTTIGFLGYAEYQFHVVEDATKVCVRQDWDAMNES
jgi:hypothetical protein